MKKRESENTQIKQEIQDMQRQIDDKKRKISDNDRAIPKLKSEINHIKLEQGKRHADLERVKREYTEKLHQANVRGVDLH